MIKVSDAFSWEQLCEFTEEDMANLLSFYNAATVPSLDDLRSMRKDANRVGFDGSFGFSVGV